MGDPDGRGRVELRKEEGEAEREEDADSVIETSGAAARWTDR
jgi:hypothetical protein